DIREGLSAIISVRTPEELLHFEGQTTGKLGTSEARSAVDAIVSEQLDYFGEENRDTATLLVRKANKASQAREAARKG
ncbi:DNA topoisomerase IV subunit B, partial [Bacillus vallismortis]|nr:DNA topoisomerase IV subunit B [Bacillus vallismortis]